LLIIVVMAVLPIIERELRVALRKRNPVRSRVRMAAGCASITLLLLFFAAMAGSRTAGHTLHNMLCLVGLYVVLQAPLLTASMFAEERRNQTLGLLFLSGLGAVEVFLSKLISAAAIAFTGLLAIFPMLALPFLTGGVSFDLFLATVFGLPTLLIFALALSLLASVISEDDGTALIVAVVLGVLVCGTTPLLYAAQSHFSAAAASSLWWLRLSPAYGPYLVWKGFPGGTAGEFWQNLGVTLIWSGVLLSAAAIALRRLWRECWEMRQSGRWRERWQRKLHGTAGRRRGLARRWLAANPFVWLAARDRQPQVLAWLVLGGISVVWLTCWAAWGRVWLSVPNCLLTAILLHLALAWIIRYTAAQTMAAPRQDGTYELLLTTPLQPSDIVWGELEALRRQFQPVAAFLLGLDLILMMAGLLVRGWNERAVFVYFVVWALLLATTWRLGRGSWRSFLVPMWASLNCGRPAHAVWRTSGFNSWVWLLLGYSLLQTFSKFRRFPTGSAGELFFVIFAVFMFLLVRATKDPLLNAAHWEQRLVSEFREIVREPLPDPHDPRFKKWDWRERFPWGWGMLQQQLHERVARRQARFEIRSSRNP
jgi:hypothetical protein